MADSSTIFPRTSPSAWAGKVIAVHLQNARLNAETPLSSLSVLGQSIAGVVGNNERRGIELANTVIRVDLLFFCIDFV